MPRESAISRLERIFRGTKISVSDSGENIVFNISGLKKPVAYAFSPNFAPIHAYPSRWCAKRMEFLDLQTAKHRTGIYREMLNILRRNHYKISFFEIAYSPTAA